VLVDDWVLAGAEAEVSNLAPYCSRRLMLADLNSLGLGQQLAVDLVYWLDATKEPMYRE
jgi:hypothetical protein